MKTTTAKPKTAAPSTTMMIEAYSGVCPIDLSVPALTTALGSRSSFAIVEQMARSGHHKDTTRTPRPNYRPECTLSFAQSARRVFVALRRSSNEHLGVRDALAKL